TPRAGAPPRRAAARADRRDSSRCSGRRAPSASPRQLHAGRADEAFERWGELSDLHAYLGDGELAQERFGDEAGQALEQVHAVVRADLDDAVDDAPVVDGRRQL